MTEPEYLLPYVPKGAWLEERYVRCGKRCRCRSADVHGTYWRLVWRERGRRRQRYIPSEHVSQYTEALERRRVQTGARRRQRSSIASAISRARAVWRSTAASISRSNSHHRLTDELD